MDVEVVGAGFAGLTCARTCAARGLRTVIWERKRDPGHAVHTTGLLVKEAAEEEDPPRGATRRIHGVRLYGPSLRWIDLDAPGYYFLATDTPALLRSLAERAADAGVELRCGARFSAERSGRVRRRCRWTTIRRGATCRPRTEPRVPLGRRSGVRGRGGRGATPCLPRLRTRPRLHRMGGTGYRSHAGRPREPAAGSPNLDRFIARVARVFDFDRARRVGTRGGLIPVGGTVRPFATRDVVLVGDAAGLVSPLTAGGIHTALRSGRAAGLAIASHLLDGGPSIDVALRGVYPTSAWKHAMRSALDLRPPNVLIDRALESPRFRALARAVFFHHRGLMSTGAWHDLIVSVGSET